MPSRLKLIISLSSYVIVRIAFSILVGTSPPTDCFGLLPSHSRWCKHTIQYLFAPSSVRFRLQTNRYN